MEPEKKRYISFFDSNSMQSSSIFKLCRTIGYMLYLVSSVDAARLPWTRWKCTVQWVLFCCPFGRFKLHLYLLLPANVVCEGYVFIGVCLSTGGGIPAYIAGGIPACLAAGPQGRGWYPSMNWRFPAHSQRGSLGGSGGGDSRSTPKGEVEGDLVQAHNQGGSWGGSGQRGASGGGVSAPGGMPAPGGCLLRGGDPPWRLLLRAVRILLECILVSWDFRNKFNFHKIKAGRSTLIPWIWQFACTVHCSLIHT